MIIVWVSHGDFWETGHVGEEGGETVGRGGSVDYLPTHCLAICEEIRK